MVLRQRLTRILTLACKHPTVLISGVVVLPIIHVLIKNKWMGAKRFAMRLAQPSSEPLSNLQISDAQEMASTMFFGVRLWRIDHQSCIARSVLLWIHLVRRGFTPSVILGAKTNHPNEFHAWVEIDHQPIDDSVDVNERYQRFDTPYLPR